MGLVWSANPASQSAARRSLPADALAVLALLPGIDWISFQHDAPAGALDQLLPGVVDEVRGLPLDEYAAALSATDVLLTVDTMAAHLAGALGHPAWVMVTTGAGWFWGLEGERCPWYAGLRLFRRPPAALDWAGVIAAVVRELSR